MIIKSPYALLSVALLFAISCQVPKDSFGSDQIAISESISNQRVLSFEEDAFGHIWIGTARGLNKYDARVFHQYFNYDDSVGLPDDQINAIFRDSRGRLWIATSGGACLFTQQGELKRIGMDDADSYLRQIFELPDGRIVFGSPTSLGVLNQETNNIELALSGLSMSSFALSPDGSLWCTEFEKISRINTTKLEIEASVPSPFKIYHCCAMPDSTLWISGIGNLAVMDTKTMEFKPLPAEIRYNTRLMGADVDLFLMLRDSTLLINTTNDGIFLYDLPHARVIHQDSPEFPYEAPRSRVNSLFEDSASNLWTGIQDGGFSVSRRLSPSTYTKRVIEDYFKGKSVTCLCRQGARYFWAGTATGELYYCNLDKMEIRDVPTSTLTHDPKGYMQINSILAHSNGDIWLLLSSKWRALRCSFDGKVLKVLQSFELIDPVSIAEDVNGNVWIGTLFGDVYRYSDSLLSQASEAGASYNSINCILPLSDGGVLLGKLNHQLTILGRPDGKAPGYLRKSALDSCSTRSGFYPTSLLSDSRGDLWIGTRKNGLIRFNSIENRMGKIEGLSCSDISAIQEDYAGNIWISTLYGLCRYEREKGLVSSYFETDGLDGSQFNQNSSCSLQDGTLLFGGPHGISVILPGEEVRTHTPRLVFEDLKVFGKMVSSLEHKPEIRLPRKMNGFSISFSALDYTGRTHITCSYKMDGYDHYWVDAGRGKEAYYSNVTPGRYLFRVRAIDKTSGEIVAEDSIKVRILPSPLLSPGAILAYILIISVIVVLALRFRRKFLRVKMEKDQAEEDRLFLLNMVQEYQKKERVRRSVNPSEEDGDLLDDGLTTADRAFLNDLVTIMKENISSAELDIDDIISTFKMSRAKFFYKVKKLTGETPGSFFRIFKLNRAASLLKEGKYNISEITDKTGFSSVSHFSTSFKKRYGVSPKEYKG